MNLILETGMNFKIDKIIITLTKNQKKCETFNG